MPAIDHQNPLGFAFEFYFDREMTPIRIFKHIDDHNGKVQLNSSGLLGPIMVGTQNARDTLGLAMGDKNTMIRLRRGQVSLQEIMLFDFILEVRRKVPVFKEIFFATPSIMLEFVPHGLTAIDKLTVNEAALEIHNFATACHAHEAAITVAVATIFYNFDTNFPLQHSSVIAAKGNVSEESVLQEAAMKLAIKQLIVNSGFIIENFVDNQAGGLALFSYNLLYIPHNSPHVYNNITVPHEATANVPDANVIAGRRALCKNLGDGPLIMSIEETATTAPGVNRKVIQAHASAGALADDIRNGTGTFLNIFNANPFDVLFQTDVYDA